MPPIGTQSYGQQPILTYPNGDIVPLVQLIPQWPRPNSSRIDGRLRWLSDSLIRPIASRYVALLEYWNAAGTEFRLQWFWFDIDWIGPGTIFKGTSGQNGDTSFDFEIGHVDALAISGLPGVYVNITLRMQGAPTLTEYHEAPDAGFGWQYNVNWNYEVGLESIPTTWPFHAGDPWPIRWCRWYPISECFPVSQLRVQDFEMLNGVSLQAVGGVSFGTSYVVPWQNPDREEGGLWFDPLQASPRTQIVVPNPFNLVWLTAQLNLTNTIQFVSAQFKLNGNPFSYRPVGSQRSCSGSAQAVYMTATSGGWIQVSPGDVIELQTGVGSGSAQVVAGVASWLQVIGIVG